MTVQLDDETYAAVVEQSQQSERSIHGQILYLVKLALKQMKANR